MVRVKGGIFTRGNTNALRAQPEHKVKLKTFEICRYLLTQELWHSVMNHNPSVVKSAQRPVENISWEDCQEFLRELNKDSSKKFRLPTEAEWEYAASGGGKKCWDYAGSPNVKEVAFFRENSLKISHPIGQKMPNEFGLFDMSGNMDEWCQDKFIDYSTVKNDITPLENPLGGSLSEFRSMRVGGFNDGPIGCHVSSRDMDNSSKKYDFLSFRLARSI